MIDTYFDRADAAMRYHVAPARTDQEDPRYWRGRLYATIIDRMAAEARSNLADFISIQHSYHRFEIRHRIRLGDPRSWWTTTMQLKTTRGLK